MECESFWVELWNVLSSAAQGLWMGFAWPHAVLVISIIIIAKFKCEIAAAIARLNKVGPVEFMPPPTPVDANTKAVMGAGVDEVIAVEPGVGLRGVPLPPIIFPHTMNAASANLDHEIGGLGPDEKVVYLKERLAFIRVLFDFETIYGSIYGGQLELLNYLNQRPLGFVSRQEVEGLWNAHRAKFNGQLDHWTFEGYLNYLPVNNLLSSGPVGYSITVKGKEFLIWMIQMGRPFQKPW